MKPERKILDKSADQDLETESLSLQDILGLKLGPKGASLAKTNRKERIGYDDTVRWPLWKTAVLVISVCLGFWIGVAAFIMHLFG